MSVTPSLTWHLWAFRAWLAENWSRKEVHEYRLPGDGTRGLTSVRGSVASPLAVTAPLNARK